MNKEIVALLKQEVKPALGCTEPIAVALATARCSEELGDTPDQIEVEVSANILKNGMGVGIPGTGMTGLQIAASLGAVCGKSEYKLEVLKEHTKEAVEKAKQMIEEGRIKISLSDTKTKLYINATAISSANTVSVTIRDSHDAIVKVVRNGKTIFEAEKPAEQETSSAPSLARDLTIAQIYDFITRVPFQDIEFILESETMNRALVEEGLNNNHGLRVGKTLLSKRNQDVYGDNLLTYSMALTAAASDARMAGSTLPAMSNSGSGNQGITVTVPVMAIADKSNVTPEELARALTLSHLVAIHIKGHLGKLSALCGCVVASTGAACGIVQLRGGTYEQICFAIKNMTGNITGMLCDGAKVGCSLKVASGVACALQSAVLALDDICISSNDGIIENDIEKTIENLGKIGSEGMQYADEMILKIMICK